jgi:hypothetical protein
MDFRKGNEKMKIDYTTLTICVVIIIGCAAIWYNMLKPMVEFLK